MLTLTENLRDHINACFTGLWVHSQEVDEAEREICEAASKNKWNMAVWNVASGLRVPGHPTASDDGGEDPLSALRALPAMANPNGTALLVLHNFHLFLNNPVVVQTAFNQLIAGKQQRTFIVVLSPVVKIPIELEKVFTVIEHPLPDKQQLAKIAHEIDDQTEHSPNTIEAAAGLTRYEAEGAFALSIARHGSISPETIWDLKAQALSKSGICTLYQGEKRSFDQLRGVDHVRQLNKQLLRPDCPVPPKGWLFVGPPGGGKTVVSKAIAADNDMPLIIADLPALKTKFVGESEERVRQFIKLCEAMAPAVVLIDEIEDALSGATADQAGDSGVSRDQLSTILKWRSESKARVFISATCNEPQALLRVKQGAFTRDGRFDGIVFFDLPDRKAKDGIWDLYRKTYKIADQANPHDEGWTPGNIEVCCQRAVQYQVTLAQAATYVRATKPDALEKLRQWAEDNNAISASTPGLYQRQPGLNGEVTGVRRLVSKKS